MRLDRFVSNVTGISRRDVQRLIRSGEVRVEGHKATSGSSRLQPNQAVTLGDQILHWPKAVYLMLNKPANYVCANTDGHHPIALDLIDESLTAAKEPLQIAGRLDLDATGLLLITNDGQWNHQITSPKSHCLKTYRVDLASPISLEAVSALEQGVQLKSEDKPTRPCTVEVLGERQLLIHISEGKYHQVKRMMAAVGNHVVALHRLRIGSIELDPDLAPGAYRHLNANEIDCFQ